MKICTLLFHLNLCLLLVVSDCSYVLGFLVAFPAAPPVPGCDSSSVTSSSCNCSTSLCLPSLCVNNGQNNIFVHIDVVEAYQCIVV